MRACCRCAPSEPLWPPPLCATRWTPSGGARCCLAQLLAPLHLDPGDAAAVAALLPSSCCLPSLPPDTPASRSCWGAPARLGALPDRPRAAAPPRRRCMQLQTPPLPMTVMCRQMYSANGAGAFYRGFFPNLFKNAPNKSEPALPACLACLLLQARRAAAPARARPCAWRRRRWLQKLWGQRALRRAALMRRLPSHRACLCTHRRQADHL